MTFFLLKLKFQERNTRETTYSFLFLSTTLLTEKMPDFADVALSVAMVIGPVVGYIDQV